MRQCRCWAPATGGSPPYPGAAPSPSSPRSAPSACAPSPHGRGPHRYRYLCRGRGCVAAERAVPQPSEGVRFAVGGSPLRCAGGWARKCRGPGRGHVSLRQRATSRAATSHDGPAADSLPRGLHPRRRWGTPRRSPGGGTAQPAEMARQPNTHRKGTATKEALGAPPGEALGAERRDPEVTRTAAADLS